MIDPREPVHIVGVGGMHMSAIARLLHERGARVSGSDLEPSAFTERLAALGVTVFAGHDAANLGEARSVIATAAARADNPELVEARRRGLPVLGRPEAVAALMAGRRVIAVAGSHGKTTTTSLIAFILSEAGRAPMYLIGGESRDLGGNASWGGDDGPCVVEADEYQRAFHAYDPDVAVITNVDADHLDLYGTREAYAEAFAVFARRTRAGGRLLVCADDPGAAGVAAAAAETIGAETYGLGEASDWRADDLALGEDGATFTVTRAGEALGALAIATPARHAVRNALAAAAACLGEGVAFESVRDAAARFRGAKRRFECVGEAGGVLVVDDYAHHPSEVRATIATARARFPGRRLIAIHQPHTYSRIAYLWDGWLDCWEGLDALIVQETYAARETPREGRSARDLAAAIASPRAVHAPDAEAAAEGAAALARPGDVALTIGAGDVDRTARLLLERLR